MGGGEAFTCSVPFPIVTIIEYRGVASPLDIPGVVCRLAKFALSTVRGGKIESLPIWEEKRSSTRHQKRCLFIFACSFRWRSPSTPLSSLLSMITTWDWIGIGKLHTQMRKLDRNGNVRESTATSENGSSPGGYDIYSGLDVNVGSEGLKIISLNQYQIYSLNSMSPGVTLSAFRFLL